MFLQYRLLMTLSVGLLILIGCSGCGQVATNSADGKISKAEREQYFRSKALTDKKANLDKREEALNKKEAELEKRKAAIIKRETAHQQSKTEIPVKEKFPATLEGAKAFVSQFVKEGADVEKLSKQLQPTHEDYLMVFNAEFAKKAEDTYTPVWKSGVLVIRGKPGQTEVHVFSGTSDDLKQWKGTASEMFPGGYKDVAKEYNDGIIIYCFKFIKPGEKFGMAFNGLLFMSMGTGGLFPSHIVLNRDKG